MLRMTRKRNPAVYQALKDYAKEYLAALRGIYREAQGLHGIHVQRPQISQNSISYVAEVKLDVLKILFDGRIEPSKLQAYHAVEMAMRVDSKVARHLDTLVGTAGSAIRVCSMARPAWFSTRSGSISSMELWRTTSIEIGSRCGTWLRSVAFGWTARHLN